MVKLTLQVKIIIAVAVVAVCAVTGGLIYHFTADNKPEEPKGTTSVAAEETEAETEAALETEAQTETETETEKATEKETEKATEKQTEKATKPAPKPTKPAAAKPAATTEKATKAPVPAKVKNITVKIVIHSEETKSFTVKTTASTVNELLLGLDFVKLTTVGKEPNVYYQIESVYGRRAADEGSVWDPLLNNELCDLGYHDKTPIKSGDELSLNLNYDGEG